jgi:zinc transport system substrate-binding protein
MSNPMSNLNRSMPLAQLSGKWSFSLLISVAAASLSGCASSLSPNAISPSPTASTIKIVTSTLPVTNFTKAVVGDRASVTYLLPPNVGPHDYQARPEDVRTLAEANVLVKNGLGIDEYLDGLVENANNSSLKIIDTSQGVQTIANEEADHEGEELGHSHEGEFNPHIWLDPKRAIEQVENIRDGLIAADPAGQQVYTANAALTSANSML